MTNASVLSVVFLKQDQGKKGFSDLSGELRNVVYRLSLINPIPVVLDVLNNQTRACYHDKNVTYKPHRDITTSLLRACRAISIESTSILLAETTFVVDLCYFRRLHPACSCHLRPLPNFSLIRRLVIRLDAALAKPKEEAKPEGRLTALKNVFTSIQHLNFCTIETYGMRGYPRYLYHRYGDELLDGTLSIVAAAKSTQDTSVLISHCQWGSVPEALWKEIQEKTEHTTAATSTSDPAAPLLCPKVDLWRWASPNRIPRTGSNLTTYGRWWWRTCASYHSTRVLPPCTCSETFDPIVEELNSDFNSKLIHECHCSEDKTVHTLTEYP